MLPEQRELTRFALHGSVIHMRCIARNQQVQAIILLKNGKPFCILSFGRRNATFLVSWCPVTFKCRIKLEFKSGSWKEFTDSPQIHDTDLRLYSPQRYKAFHVCLKHRSLLPRA